MEDFNMVNDMEVVTEAPQDTEATTSEVTEEVTTESVVETAKPQSAEENARFAAARRQAEAEKNALKAQNDRLMQALGQYGYQGSPEEIADTLMAQAQEYADFERMQIQGEAEFYKNIAIEKMMADDLTKIKEAYPDVKVKHLKELGNEFFSALNATKDAVLAYDVIQTKKARETKPIPRDIGAVNSSSSKEKDFYTSAEVDKLTSKDYDNPRIMERVRQSMLKW
jgi:hypothetical protein